MASTKMTIYAQKDGSSSSKSMTISKEPSPDSKCPICLDKFKNVSYVDKCLHRFCFLCIREWSKNKAECPLCKQPFSSIYHSISSDSDFKQYDLPPMENGSFGNLMGQRFRYRTTQTGRWRAAARQASPPSEQGVIFSSATQGTNRDIWRMLAARQRARSEGRPPPTLHDREMIRFRRAVYRRGLWVRGVQDGGRSRETSVEFFRGNPACVHRLVPWLRRELTVLYGAHGSLVNIVQHIIMSQITRYDMQDPAVLQELRPFLLSRTEHFLHEFMSFARSPFNMEAYDQHAVYDSPSPSAEVSGGSNSSVIAVSEDEPETSSSPAAALSQAAWDDETPGPSYSGEAPPVLSVSLSDSESDSRTEEEAEPSAALTVQEDVRLHEEEHSSSEEECVIVGYIKPVAERTPELVQLSSDSEESEQEGQAGSPYQPQHINSPTTSRSEASHRHRGSPQTSNSKEHHPPSTSHSPQKSTRRHSKSKRKKRSRSRERKRFSYGHRRHSRSRSPHSHNRRRAREAKGYSTSSYLGSHTRHSYEKQRSSTSYYTETHHSSFMSPAQRSHARSSSHFRACSRSRSRARSRSKSWRRGGRSQQRRHSGSRSPLSHDRSHHDKPSGKRKYKSLHVEPCYGTEADERKNREKAHKSRSSSMEAFHKGRKHHKKKKKKHKKKSKSKRSKDRTGKSSPIIITINSNSGSDEDGSTMFVPTNTSPSAADCSNVPQENPVGTPMPPETPQNNPACNPPSFKIPSNPADTPTTSKTPPNPVDIPTTSKTPPNPADTPASSTISLALCSTRLSSSSVPLVPVEQQIFSAAGHSSADQPECSPPQTE